MWWPSLSLLNTKILIRLILKGIQFVFPYCHPLLDITIKIFFFLNWDLSELRAKKKCEQEEHEGVITPLRHVYSLVQDVKIGCCCPIVLGCILFVVQLLNISSQNKVFTLGEQSECACYSSQTIFFLCQAFVIQVHRVVFSIRNRDSILLALGLSSHKSTQPSKRMFTWGHILFFHSFLSFSSFTPFPILSLCVWGVNTQHQGKHFYLHFKMSNSKQSGVHNHSALVTLNITERRMC